MPAIEPAPRLLHAAAMTDTSNFAPITLPGTEIQLSPLGLGTWAWGDSSTWGLNGYDRSYNFETIQQAYERSVALGVTFLDTAEAYGKGESERIIARLLAADPANRQRVVIATKFIPFPWRISVTTALLASLRASLERLQMPWVHLYQIHGPISLRSHQAMADALAAAHQAGLVKAVGVSNYSERETRAIHAALTQRGLRLATNQVEYSLLRTLPDSSGLLKACRELGVTVLAYSPIGQGRLTGKYNASNPPPGRRNFSAYPMQEIEPIVAELARLGSAHGDKTPSQVALNWLMCKGAVPIPGAKNAAQAEQNAGALGWRLSADEIARLDRLAKPGQRSLFHRIWQHG
jgi:aryl-alcohol dehydrogenase-like predicted oxidoreductase